MSDAIQMLQDNLNALNPRDRSFASDLLGKFDKYGSLSVKQSYWIEELAKRATGQAKPEPQKADLGSFDGVIQLFKKAQQHLKFPKIHLQLADGSPIALSVAGKMAQQPGTVNVTDGKPFGQNKWYGRVTPAGAWQQSGKAEPVADELGALLKKLAANPARAAAEYGKLVGVCCFCNSKLSAGESTAVGYGKTCAANFGMPWGVKAPELAF